MYSEVGRLQLFLINTLELLIDRPDDNWELTEQRRRILVDFAGG